jgi:hypothetical protein
MRYCPGGKLTAPPSAWLTPDQSRLPGPAFSTRTTSEISVSTFNQTWFFSPWTKTSRIRDESWFAWCTISPQYRFPPIVLSHTCTAGAGPVFLPVVKRGLLRDMVADSVGVASDAHPFQSRLTLVGPGRGSFLRHPVSITIPAMQQALIRIDLLLILGNNPSSFSSHPLH